VTGRRFCCPLARGRPIKHGVTEPELLQQVDRTYVLSQGRKLSYFAGCDYFRLASHPKVLAAVQTGLERFGLNVAASRLTTGNHALYQALEISLARYFGVQAAVLVPTGYLSNLVVAQALQGEFTEVYVDEAAHSSLLDAAMLLKARTIRFKHRDPEDLATKALASGRAGKAILVTDGMFARDGSVAPLRKYQAVLPPGAVMLIDDAHGAGVLGTHGRGTPEYEQVASGRLIQTVTLSKACGTYGGAVLCTRTVRQKITARSRIFVGSTPIPLPLAQAALAALRILEQGGAVRQRLSRNTAYVRQQLRTSGIPVEENPGPIIPVVPQSAQQRASLQAKLLAQGVYPSFIKYPGAPASGYFRFVISSEHTRAQLDSLARALRATAPSGI
jgi:7-keto-8-aminopelargonate synthetase-like enzyme